MCTEFYEEGEGGCEGRVWVCMCEGVSAVRVPGRAPCVRGP